MIVIIAEQQILYPQKVCQNCLMSNNSGLPRWHNNKLACGKIRVQHTTEAKIYQCLMGFDVTWID